MAGPVHIQRAMQGTASGYLIRQGDTEIALILDELDSATLRRERDGLSLVLHARAVKACPGAHQPVQHRDGRAPWCRACRCSAEGIPVEEMPGVGGRRG